MAPDTVWAGDKQGRLEKCLLLGVGDQNVVTRVGLTCPRSNFKVCSGNRIELPARVSLVGKHEVDRRQWRMNT